MSLTTHPVPSTGADTDAADARRSPSPVAAVVGLVVALLGCVAVVGGDARWLVAVGGTILRTGEVPDRVPYALAETTGWHDVPALAQVIAYGVAQVGSAGLLALHIAAVAVALLLLAKDARRAATSGATAVALAGLAVGSVPTLFVVRLQLFSLVCFALLLQLLRGDARRPSKRIWAVPVLIAVWGNLHGAVLLGVAVTLTYLAVSRARTGWVTALGTAAASCVALLATPAGSGTVEYYRSVAVNQAAQEHVGLWARLSPSNPFDIAVVALGLLMALCLVRARPPLWERLAVIGLTIALLLAARNGVWLLMFLVAPAARGLPQKDWRHGRTITAGTLVAALVLGGVAVVRGPATFGASSRLVAETVALSGRCPLYAEEALGEQVVEAGGTVWITNPLDAFSPDEQKRYVDWVQTGALDAVPEEISAFLVLPGGSADEELRRSRGMHVVLEDRSAVLYREAGVCQPSG